MPLISKNYPKEVRETSLTNHLALRSSHKSVPLVGLARQPQTVEVEVQFYG